MADHPNNHALALKAVARLKEAGFQAFFAGGCVRDHLLDRTPKDFDVATAAEPDQVEALFSKTLGTGKAFGVIQVIEDGQAVEVATFRKDLSYEDGRHPSDVQFTTPEEDAKRRDFTINGMFMDPLSDEIHDFVGGKKDLQAKQIRAIGQPADRFTEDHLRMLRAVRFSSVLGFTIEPETLAAIQGQAHQIKTISPERIREEITRLLVESPRAGDGMTLLDQAGLLEHILPEVKALQGVEQPPLFHPEGDVWTHTMMMLNEAISTDPALFYSILFHDIAKPATYDVKKTDDGKERICFYGHDKKGAMMAEAILTRLRCSNSLIRDVSHNVKNHMRFMHVREMKRSTLRRLIGAPTFPVELELHRLDCLCSHGDLSNITFLEEAQKNLKDEPALPTPWISGKDIMAMGVKEGPRVGKWHKRAYDAQLNGTFDDPGALKAWVEEQINAGKKGAP